MHRFLLSFFLLLVSSLSWSGAGFAQSADGLPARPSPFRFVTDEAKLLTEANAKTLETGLRSYADETGTQIVVVTVPSLGGRSVSDYGRALGEAWGIGQRDKNNGIVLLLSGQERKVTIQAGSGLQSVITPELTARVINQQMTPSFKQGNYFMGLRKGLNTLMLAANPSSDPRKNQAATASSGATQPDAAPATAASPELGNTPAAQSTDLATEPFKPQSSVPAPEPSGLGIGTLAVGALLIGGVIWLLVRLFRRRNTAPAAPGNTPDFYGNRPAGPNGPVTRGTPQQPAPDFYGNGNRTGGNMGNNNTGGGFGGSGMGGILATGAAAAAGAYLGNRMASGGHNDNDYNSGHNAAGFGGQPSSLDPGAAGLAGATGAGTGAASGSTEFPALGNTDDTAPDYFSDAATNDSEPDYFASGESSSYDDLSSDDTGGGGFDSDDDNSGSW
ncbi:TPM domain-containing protein [Hymenobacter sp. BT186]|uniref:TPM domain-containing protein n=1 Tax=Hymenobacter telluris TaxID=2816474 RepID=A0A939JFD3_9BACT|nr:TPM domain-containing protein [Hymenobacter telluris]MBO0360297.1 TPM domain-containing protein [Hymenobacter telluris]MBW3376324.1 TPM domain-containing protein [Hymenobacter norwichensis]